MQQRSLLLGENVDGIIRTFIKQQSHVMNIMLEREF
jgi:hypothetical protein